MQNEQRKSVLDAWRNWCGFDGFQADGVRVAVRAPEPDNTWVSVVRLGDSTLVSVPTGFDSAFLENCTGDLTDPNLLHSLIGEPAQQLGPAELFFLESAGSIEHVDVFQIGNSDERINRLMNCADDAEAGESGIADVESDLWVIADGDEIIAACGWEIWQPNVAHICILTHPGYRGLGLAKRVASSASAAALAQKLVPQWRSRVGNVASANLAKSLGYELFGRQLSFRM